MCNVGQNNFIPQGKVYEVFSGVTAANLSLVRPAALSLYRRAVILICWLVCVGIGTVHWGSSFVRLQWKWQQQMLRPHPSRTRLWVTLPRSRPHFTLAGRPQRWSGDCGPRDWPCNHPPYVLWPGLRERLGAESPSIAIHLESLLQL